MMKSVLVTLAVLLCAIPAAAQRPASRNASLPAVSPDGHWIAFAADRADSVYQIYVVNEDGSGERLLTTSRDDKHTPAWSADGKEVLFQTQTGDTTALWAVPRKGGAPRILVTRVAKSIALSPDGRRIAFTVGEWTRNRIVVSAIDGNGATAITDSSVGYFNQAWSRDGKRIAVSRIDSTRDLQVWVMDADGGHAHALTRFTKPDGRPQWPAWSPDGRRIAIQAGIYSRETPGKSTAHIWVIDVATATATRIAPHETPRLDETPSWFSDGKRIAFQSDRTGRMEIWLMNADGTHERQVTK